jgi:hypothetical protein
MLRELNEDLMTQMHFVEFFSMLTIIEKLILTILTWYIVYVNNNKEVDFNNPHMIHCILCCNNLVIDAFNPKI